MSRGRSGGRGVRAAGAGIEVEGRERNNKEGIPTIDISEGRVIWSGRVVSCNYGGDDLAKEFHRQFKDEYWPVALVLEVDKVWFIERGGVVRSRVVFDRDPDMRFQRCGVLVRVVVRGCDIEIDDEEGAPHVVAGVLVLSHTQEIEVEEGIIGREMLWQGDGYLKASRSKRGGFLYRTRGGANGRIAWKFSNPSYVGQGEEFMKRLGGMIEEEAEREEERVKEEERVVRAASMKRAARARSTVSLR